MVCKACGCEGGKTYLTWVNKPGPEYGDVIFDMCDECFAKVQGTRYVITSATEPVKSKVVSESTGGGNSPTGKKRGRPPGSKNKATLERERLRREILMKGLKK